MKRFKLLGLLLASISFLGVNAQNLQLVELADGFSLPVDIASAGDDRLFVVEQDGAIQIVLTDGTRLETPFLDIDPIVNSQGSERGLLGLAFHPDYDNNGYFFVNYTANGNGATRVSRFSVTPDNPNQADPNSELILMTVGQPFSNHNGGGLKFGPDGYLYIGLGDGGSANDPGNRSQNPQELLGKMLRIDVDNVPAGQNYGIPADNPYVDPNDGILDEIWSLGLRNPWRFSFDRLTGDLWIADVGQNEVEEVHYQPADSDGGENYGWRCYEGSEPFNTSNCGPASDYVFPVSEYNHNQGCSITGGFVYRGCNYPAIYGAYVFVDYCSGVFFTTRPDGNGGWITETLNNLNNFQYTSFGQDANGELYVTAHSQGRIFRLTETTEPFEGTLDLTQETCAGDADGVATFNDNGAIGDVDVVWSTGAQGATIENLEAGAYSYTISGANGCTQTNTFTISNQSPEVPLVEWDGTVLSGPAGFEEYAWYLDGTFIDGATSVNWTPSASGAYTLEITNQAGCSALSEAIEVTIDQVDVIEGILQVVIQPNPLETEGVIEIQTDRLLPVAFRVQSSDGRIIESWETKVQGTAQWELDLTAASAGVYQVLIQVDNKQLVRQLIKQ